MSGAISNYIREYNNLDNNNIRGAKEKDDNIMSNNIKSDDFVSANILSNTSLKVIRHYFEYSSMTCAYSHDLLIIQSNNRREYRVNLSLIHDPKHSSNYKQAMSENFQRAMSGYNILYNLRDDIVTYGYIDIYDPKVAEQLYKAVTITLYNDAKVQRWAKFDVDDSKI